MQKAGIATTLEPLLKNKITQESTIRIVGSRCANLDDEKYPHWTALLDELIAKGASIIYLMIDPTPKSEGLLKDFQENHPVTIPHR